MLEETCCVPCAACYTLRAISWVAAPALFLDPGRHADASRDRERFQTGRDVDAVAEDIAVIRDNVADMNADTKLNPLCRCNVEIGAGYSELDVDGAACRIDRADKLRQHSVAVGSDDAATMLGDLGIDQACPIILEPAERPFLVQANQSAVPGNIGREDR
jgi:hypothetical protein